MDNVQTSDVFSKKAVRCLSNAPVLWGGKNRTIKKIDRWVFAVRVTLRRGGVKRERQERQLDVSVYQLRLSEPLTHPERAIHFSEEPRDRERRSAPWSVFFLRVISSRSVRESVLFCLYIAL